MPTTLTRRLTVLTVVIVSLWPVTPALAAPALNVRLVDFPVSLGPQDALKVVLEVTNSGDAPVDNLEVTVSIHEGVTSRSQLHATYTGRLGRVRGSDTFPFQENIRPGASRTIEVVKPLAELVAFRGSRNDRAYPIRIQVRAGSAEAEAIDTYMMFFSEPPLNPLSLSLVIPMHAPSIYTDGRRPNLVGSDALARAITSGRIAKLLPALEEFPNLPITLGPSGLLLKMLDDLGNGYVSRSGGESRRVGQEDPRAQAAAQTLARLQALALRPPTRVVTTEYSRASLPVLVRSGLEDRAEAQLLEGRNLLGPRPTGVLGAQPLRGWLLPARGSLDEITLQEVERSGFDRLILAPGSLTEVPGSLTRGIPVEVAPSRQSTAGTPSGRPTLAVVSDPELEDVLEQSEELAPVEARQRFLAESATIHLERPSQSRAIVAVAPVQWNLETRVAEALMSGLAQAPWLRAVTPDVIVNDIKPQSQAVRLISQRTALENGPEAPGQDYFPALQQAHRAIRRYASLAPPPARLASFSRRLLIAESTDWWSTTAGVRQARQFARAVPPAVSTEISRIQAPAPQTITLTSRAGVIPLSVGSRLAYPVDIVVRLDSDKLRFPDGNRITIQNLQPPNHTVRVRAITQASGTFPLKVSVLSPAGLTISESLLTIRSTAYNIVALSITGGAGLFLVGWWMIGAARRRIKWHGAT
jgi:hypothetical protein